MTFRAQRRGREACSSARRRARSAPAPRSPRSTLARKSLIGKAMARPDQVRKVLDTLKKEGIASTYHKVRNKLDCLSPLGYSAAGRVVAVGEGCEGSASVTRSRAPARAMPITPSCCGCRRTCAPRSPTVSPFEEAAFSTIGAIALQGVRQAEAHVRRDRRVIGLGLIGQLTVQLLRACGCQVVGVDVDPWKVDLARQHGIDLALLAADDVVGQTHRLTDGRGADAIIITAATSDNDPIVLAGELARDRAHVVIVGAVPSRSRARPTTRRSSTPAVPILRPRALRPRLRGEGPRLPDRLRALDGEPQHAGVPARARDQAGARSRT